jgi:hypothetical protein
MERTSMSVDDHLASLGGQRGEDIRALDRAIRERIPDAERLLYEGKLWGGSDQRIVGYGIMDYQNRSGEDVRWFVVGLAAQKTYISMYVNAVEGGTYLLAGYEGRLGKVKTGTASISFDSVDDVDFEILMELVDRAGQSVG